MCSNGVAVNGLHCFCCRGCDRSTHPEAFADMANGNFYLEVYVPPNVTAYGIRTQDYRVFVLPENALVSGHKVDLDAVI